MWKLNVVDGVVLCAILYKSSKGDSLRKLAAGGIIREPKELRNLARKKFTDIIKEDFKRSIMEVSGNMYEYLKKIAPKELEAYKIPSKDVEKFIGKEIEIVDEYEYKRKIGDQLVSKRLFGTPKNFY